MRKSDARQVLACTSYSCSIFIEKSLLDFLRNRNLNVKMSDEELKTVFKSFCAFGAGSKD